MSAADPALELAEERRRVDDLARVLPLAALEPDGLAITSDGTYVRVIEADHVLQPWRGDIDHRLRLRERLKQLITRIPDRQGLQFIVEAEPLDPRRALTQDWLEIRAAIAARRREGAEEAAIEAMENFGYGLEQTVRRSAGAVNAVRMRWWIVVPYRHRPASIELPRLRRRDALTLSLRDHEQAAYESSRLAANILSDLRGLECRARELDGGEYLALLWRWFHPGAEPYPAELFERLPRLLAATDVEVARRHRGELLAAVTRGAAIDLADPEHIAYPNAGQVESIAHVTTPPDTTSLYWLLNLMTAPPPWRLSVHIHARDRAKTRRHYRLRWRRIWAGLQRKQREAKLISPEEFEQEREAGEIDAELRLSASGVYDVSILHSQRAAAERVELLDDERRAIAREMEGATDARLYGGRFLGERSFVSCLPLGTNALGRHARLRLAQHRRLRSAALHLGELAGRGADRLRDPRQHPGADRPLRPRLPHPRRPDHRRLGWRQDGLRQHHPDALDRPRRPGHDRRSLLLGGRRDRDPGGRPLRGPGRPGARRREAPLRGRSPRRGALPLGRPRSGAGELGEDPLPPRPAHAADRGSRAGTPTSASSPERIARCSSAASSGSTTSARGPASARASRSCGASCSSSPAARRSPRTPTAIPRSPPSSAASPPGFTPTARAAPTPGSPTRRRRSPPSRRCCSATSPGFTPTWPGR